MLFLSLWASFVAMRRLASFKIITKGGHEWEKTRDLAMGR